MSEEFGGCCSSILVKATHMRTLSCSESCRLEVRIFSGCLDACYQQQGDVKHNNKQSKSTDEAGGGCDPIKYTYINWVQVHLLATSLLQRSTDGWISFHLGGKINFGFGRTDGWRPNIWYVWIWNIRILTIRWATWNWRTLCDVSVRITNVRFALSGKTTASCNKTLEQHFLSVLPLFPPALRPVVPTAIQVYMNSLCYNFHRTH